MNWLMLLVALLFPVMQQGVQHAQSQVAQKSAVQAQYHFDGRHYWCWHQNQWYVWTGAQWQLPPAQGGTQ